ncbi:hypothetical protein [Streptomyces sp. NBC_00233]|uniref:hypothetical protein n=1 Tax=Streptomyces sp. NBC_00233 TaxID=2975686 RepID=UPI00224E909A|nr:hypothetical protein [Streptomyces sp. NBC_00233]MCX5229844.1 hypothetical protein [Streptomyces sp. NBC_00233]
MPNGGLGPGTASRSSPDAGPADRSGLVFRSVEVIGTPSYARMPVRTSDFAVARVGA